MFFQPWGFRILILLNNFCKNIQDTSYRFCLFQLLVLFLLLNERMKKRLLYFRSSSMREFVIFIYKMLPAPSTVYVLSIRVIDFHEFIICYLEVKDNKFGNKMLITKDITDIGVN